MALRAPGPAASLDAFLHDFRGVLGERRMRCEPPVVVFPQRNETIKESMDVAYKLVRCGVCKKCARVLRARSQRYHMSGARMRVWEGSASASDDPPGMLAGAWIRLASGLANR